MSWIAASYLKKEKKMAYLLKMSAAELGEAFENNLIDLMEALKAYSCVIEEL